MRFSYYLQRFGSHDTLKGTDKDTTHSYGDIYDTYFQPFQHTTKNILEIGISGGFGIQALHAYFLNAIIYGVDIKDSCNSTVKTYERVRLVFKDVRSNTMLGQVPPTFDIIVEDASHMLHDQIRHFKEFCTAVNPGGIYIIEDIHGKHLEALRDELEPFAKSHGFTLVVHDLRNKKGRFDDILFVFIKAN
jgi:SAM-dependent methyltransferase